MDKKDTKSGQTDDFLKVQDLLCLCLAEWKWFVLSLLIAFSVATVYVLRAPLIFLCSVSVLIKDDTDDKTSLVSQNLIADSGYYSNNNIYNEQIAFKSLALMPEVVKRLHLDMSYFVSGRFHYEVAYSYILPAEVAISRLSASESGTFTLDVQPNGTLQMSDFTRNG